MEPIEDTSPGRHVERSSSKIFQFLRSAKQSSDEESSFSLENYLPWRDSAPLPPQHVDLRGVTGNEVAEESVAAESASSAAPAQADAGMMEKLLRGLLPRSAPGSGLEQIGPLEACVTAVTGESLCLKISAGAFSEVSSKLLNQLRQAQTDGVVEPHASLDRIIQHLHLRPAAIVASVPQHRRDETLPEEGGVVVDLANAENIMDMPLRHAVSSPSSLGGTSTNNNNNNIVNMNNSNPAMTGGYSGSMLLYRIPLAIVSCRRLSSLVIEDQQLLSLEDLLACEQLEELRILNCELREVPSQLLQKLPKLRLLDLRRNLLTSVVMGGSVHDHMLSVCMAHNQIAAVPQVLCRMPNLTELDISFNRLSSLPSELRQISSLVRLNIEGNALVTPSVALIRGVLGSIDVVTRFPRLLQLNLSRNKITELPHYIDYLSSLTELIVSDNRITRIPVQLVTVANLSMLDLSGNPLGSVLPSEVTMLKSLSVLRVSGCKLSSFPHGLAMLSHLKEFDVSRNGIRHIEKSEVFGMASLTSLNASRNRLEDCDFLLELQSLVKLDVSMNCIKVFPDEIHVLESLRFLNAGQNQLKGLPHSFGQLYNLEEVDLSNNTLDSLGSFWNSSSFPRLRVLLLEGNSPRLISSLQFAFSTLLTLESLSMLGVVVDENNLIIANPARFDLQLVIQVTVTVRHPLLLAAFFGLVSRHEYREGVMAGGGIELMLSLCEMGLNGNRPGMVHKDWPPKDIFQPDTARYLSLKMLTSLTHKMDAMGPRWAIYLHGASAVLMDVINRHPDVRYKLLCIRLLGNLALHPDVKRQIFYNKSEIVTYLEGLARTTHSDSIKRFCNRTFAIFGICQHFQRSLLTASLGRRAGVRILALDGGGTRSLVTLEMLVKLRDMTGKRISDMFDLIVGVSAGGLIALSLLVGKTLEDMADVYLNRGYMCFSPEDEVARPPSDFSQSSWNKTIRPLINLATKGSMYRVKTYERELQRYFGNATMISTSDNDKNPKVAVVSTLTSVKPALPYICRNYDYPPDHMSRYGGDVTWRLWEVARATSAAPSFFDPFERDGLQLMDGGIVANNPAAIAYHEYLKIWGREIPISLLLSLGTGVPNSTPVPKERGIMDTFEQLVDAALSQDRAHEALSDALPPGTPYFRLQPSGPQFASRLDEIRKSELQKAQVSARQWIAENLSTFEKIAAILSDDKPDAKKIDESESADDTSFIDDISEDEESVQSSYNVKLKE